MTPSIPLRGWPVTVIRTAHASTVHHPGVLTTVLAHVLVVTAEGIDTWKPRDAAVVAAGEHGERLVTLGEVGSVCGDRAVLLVPSPWRGLDLRTSERHQIRLKVVIFAQGRRDGVVGQTVDISKGGMAVESPVAIAATDLEVLVRWEQFESHLPCSIVGSRLVGTRHVHHLRFRALSSHQAAFVRSVVNEIEEHEFNADLPS